MGAILAMLGGMIFVVLAIAVFMIICMWKVFSKAGQPGWAVLIPIYREVVLMNVATKPVWWFILLFIPIVGFIIAIIVMIQIAKNFGKGAGFGIGLIFLPIIFWPMLAFSKSAVYNPQPAA